MQPFIVQLHCAPSYCNQHLAQYWFITKLQISLPCSLCAPLHQKKRQHIPGPSCLQPHTGSLHQSNPKRYKNACVIVLLPTWTDVLTCDCPFWGEEKKVTCTPVWNQKSSRYKPSLKEKWILSREKLTVLTERGFNTADVSLSAREARRRRATLSQSPAMHSTLPATISFVKLALFLLFFLLYIKRELPHAKVFHNMHKYIWYDITSPEIHILLVMKKCVLHKTICFCHIQQWGLYY